MTTDDDLLKVLIADPSVIVRTGLSVVLKRIPGYRIQPFEISVIDNLEEVFDLHKPDILIVNPSCWGVADMRKLRERSSNSLKIVALLSSMYSDNLLKKYDESLSIYDDGEKIKEKLDKLIYGNESREDKTNEENDNLSAREKEILVEVVRGLTNKEIAEKLFLSAHTVITHRRNIARKLEIHSTAGLTVYAIVNKLVELDEIKN